MDKLAVFLQSIRPIKDGDMVDQLHYFYSVMACTIPAIVVFGWSFVGQPIECWWPPQFKGWWNEYGRDYCFAENTYYLQFTEVGAPKSYFDLIHKQVEIPKTDAAKQERTIAYYQWVPFVLVLMACCFWAPVIIWRALCNQVGGIKVKAVLEIVSLKENVSKEGKEKTASKIARFMDASLLTKEAIHGRSALTGRGIIALYIFIKILFLFNVIAQFFILQAFLGTKTNWWGVEVLNDLMHGRTWAETGNFPRVTYCKFDIRADMTNIQHHDVQCVLLINFINEKIFIFLWFWYLVVACITAISLIYWIATSISPNTGRKIVTGYLGLSEKALEHSPRAQSLINRFIKECVRPDGIFLIRMVGFQGGDLVAAELTQALWANFKRRHGLDAENNGQTPNANVSLASPYSGFPTLPRYDEAMIAEKESDF